MQKFRKHFGIPFLFTFFIIFLGGFVELYSIKTKGIFCAMQTGNLLNIFVALINEKYQVALLSSLVLAVFLLGCFLAELLRLYFPKRRKLWYFPTILVLESLFLIPLLFISNENSGTLYGHTLTSTDALTDSLLALYGSFHFISFREENHTSFTPTMMTNMMKNIMVSLASGIFEKNKDKCILALSYFVLVLAFVSGAVTFYLILFFTPKENLEHVIQYLPGIVILMNLLLIPLSVLSEKKDSEEYHPE